jgi:hypothetical protein
MSSRRTADPFAIESPEHEHPAMDVLESFAAGDARPEVAAHLLTCAPCAAAVATLRTELESFRARVDAPAFARAVLARAGVVRHADVPESRQAADGAEAPPPLARARARARARAHRVFRLAPTVGPLLALAAGRPILAKCPRWR